MLESGRPIGIEVLIQEGGWFVFRMLSVMVLFFPLFLCRMIGAGDIKLFSLVCGFLGYGSGAAVLGFGFAVGAVWSFFKMLSQGSSLYRFSYLIAYFRRIYHTRQITAYYNTSIDRDEAVIPLGVCLFFGAMLYDFLINIKVL